MPEVCAGRREDYVDGQRRQLSVGEVDIAVFRIGEEFVAYRNVCPHQGGPVCEGLLIHKVEEVIGADRTYAGMRFSDAIMHLSCPWHGWEFDIRTGACAGDGAHRLRRHEIVERSGELFVRL